MSSEMVKAGDESREKVIESLVLRGDLSGLTPAQRAAHYHRVCDSLGLNPDSQPFAYLKLNGKEILYAGRGATDQLAAIHRVNREIIDGPRVMDLAGTKVVYCVAKATHPNGRTETSIATLPFVDPVNVLMKAETKAKRRATLSILGLGMLDETEVDTIPGAQRVETATIGIEQTAAPTLSAPSTWATDLAACSTLRDVRACYQSHRTPDTDGTAMARDVRAWLSARGLSVPAEGVTALLGTLHDGAVSALSLALCSEETPSDAIETAIVHAARALRATTDVDAHSRAAAWKILRRTYATLTGAASLDAAGAALLAAMDADDEPDPDGPGKGTPSREPGEDDGEDPAGYDAHRAAQDSQPSAEHAWRETAAGITAHVASLSSARHLEASARRHLREIREDLTTHAVHAYAGRAQRLSHDGTSALPWDECVARVETWLREGPRVSAIAPTQRRAKRAA